MLRLLRSGLAAIQKSGNAALCSRFPAERFVAPYALCDVLDAFGVPVPTCCHVTEWRGPKESNPRLQPFGTLGAIDGDGLNAG